MPASISGDAVNCTPQIDSSKSRRPRSPATVTRFQAAPSERHESDHIVRIRRRCVTVLSRIQSILFGYQLERNFEMFSARSRRVLGDT